MNKNPSEPRTWTFQPDDDVRLAVSERIGKSPPRKARTTLINDALRGHLRKHVADYHRRLADMLDGGVAQAEQVLTGQQAARRKRSSHKNQS